MVVISKEILGGDFVGGTLKAWTSPSIRGATKGGLEGAQAPQPKKGVPCNSARSDDFFY